MKTVFETEIKKIGNSHFVRIPKNLMDIKSLKEGDVITVTIEKSDY